MECFSQSFKRAVVHALESPNIVIGTITLGGTDFIHEIKRRKDIDITEVTLKNRDLLPDEILGRVSGLFNPV
jgi:nucleoside-triphosphatase THEP1